MSILIGADIVPTNSNSHLFKDGNVMSLVGMDLLNVFNEVDYRVFNLETPLVDFDSPIEKGGAATLRADGRTIIGLKKMGIDLFTLANNHIMDHGFVGFESTIKFLNEEQISYFGVGGNLYEAIEPHIVKIKGKIIGFYACAEHEFSIADAETPGANPFDALNSFEHVKKLKKEVDFLVILYHGGKEYYRYPSPMLQRVCRKFIQNGADLVVCQHSHCIGCEEKYDNGTIIYGQGNFIFDNHNDPAEQTSLLIKINDDFSIEYLPLIKVKNGVRLAKGEFAKQIMNEFRKRGCEIMVDNFVKSEYNKLAKKMLGNYMLVCSGFYNNWILRVFDKVLGHRLRKIIWKYRYTSKEMMAIRNYIECETHRELWIEGLKNKW